MFSNEMSNNTRPTNKVPSNKSVLGFIFAILTVLTACGSANETVSATVDDSTAAVSDDISFDDPVAVDPEAEETIDDGSELPPLDVDALTSQTWSLQFGGGPDGEVQFYDGHPLTIAFNPDGTFGGTAACNGYAGTYGLDGSQVFFADVSWTEIACEPDVQASEAAFLSALMDIIDINLIGDEMALSGPSSELIFGPPPAISLQPLFGQGFTLESILVDGELIPVLVNDEIGDDVVLAPLDTTFLATTGCRNLEIELTTTTDEVLVSEFMADGECSPEFAPQDQYITSVLGDSFTFEYDGEHLTIAGAGAGAVLTYRDSTSDGIVDAPDEISEDAPDAATEG